MDKFRQAVIRDLEKATKLDKKLINSLIEIPEPNFGDYAFPTFSLAKQYKKNPKQIAEEIAQKLEVTDTVRKIEVKGPYVNFFINPAKLSEYTLNQISKDNKNYGKSKIKPKTILLEGWQPNTHKAFHIGHIRNAVLSESLARILEFYGNKVIRCAYIGDVGAHIAKWIWYYNKFYKGTIPKKGVSKWAGEIYTKASKKSYDNEQYQKEIHEIHKRLEQGDTELVKLWKKTRKLCLEDFDEIFKELDSNIGKPYYESEVEQPGIKIVKELVKKGFAKYSDGAVVIDLDKFNLGTYVLLKSSGASLYSTKDLALAHLKSKENKFDLSLHVVGSEQKYHFQQFFKTLDLMGYKDAKKLVHVYYGLVTLKAGKMSSRLGNIILYEDFRDQLMQGVRKQIKDLKLSKKEKEHIIRIVAFGAMKFTMLCQDPHKRIVFDPDQSLSFEGETGPYIQYTHARICSILRKAEKISNKIDFSKLTESLEHNLIRQLANFPAVIEEAALRYKPNLIAHYLIDLAQLFNEFYHKYPVLKAEPELRKARLMLIDAVRQVLENGLALLAIEAPERM